MDLTQMTNMDAAGMGRLIDYFEELSRRLDSLPEVRNVSPDSNFVSCIRFDGAPILPPILTARRKEELAELKRLAIRRETQMRASQRRHLLAKAKAIVAKTQNQGLVNESHSYTQSGEGKQRGPISSASYTKVPAPDRPSTRGPHSRIPVHQGAQSSTQNAEPAEHMDTHWLSGSPSYSVVQSNSGTSQTSREGTLNDLSGAGLSESQPFSAFLRESSVESQQGPTASRSYTVSTEQSFLMQSGLLGMGQMTGPAGTLAERDGGQWDGGLSTLDSQASDLPSLEDTALPTDFNGLPLTSIRQQQISQVLAKLSKVLNIKDSTGFNSTSSSDVSEMTLTMQQMASAAQQPGGLANFPPPLGPSLQPSQLPITAPQRSVSHPLLSAPPGPQLSSSQPSLRQHLSEGDLSIFHESQDTVVEVEHEPDQSDSSHDEGSSPGNNLSQGGSHQGLNNLSGSTQSNPFPQHNSSVSSANTSCTSDSQRSSRSSPRSSKNTVRFSSTVTEFSAGQSAEGRVSKRCRDLTPTSSPQGPQMREGGRARGGQAEGGTGSLLSRVAFNPDMESSSSASEPSPEVPFGAYEQSSSDKENDVRPPSRVKGSVQDSQGSSQCVGSSQASTLVGASQSSFSTEASQVAGVKAGTVSNSLSSEKSGVTSAASESGSSTLREEDALLQGGLMSSAARHAISQGRKSSVGRFFPPVADFSDYSEGESTKESESSTRDLSKGPYQKFPQQPNISVPAPNGLEQQGTNQHPAAGKDSKSQNLSQPPRSDNYQNINHTNVFQSNPPGKPGKSSQANPFFKAPVLHRHHNGVPNGVHHPEDLKQPEKKFRPGHARKGSYTLEAPSPVLLHAQSAVQSNGGLECVTSSVMKPLSRKLEYEDEDELDEEVLRAQPVSLPMPDMEMEAKKEYINKYLIQLEQQRSCPGQELSPQASRGLPQHHSHPHTGGPTSVLSSQIAADLATIQSILGSLQSNPNISQEELLSLQTQHFELARQALIEQQQHDLEELFVMQRREQLTLQQEIEEHQRTLRQQQDFLEENDPENLKPAKTHSPEDNTQARPHSSFTYVSSPSLDRHPRDRDDVSTFSQTTPKKSLFTRNSTNPALRKPVVQSPYRPIPLPKRNVRVVVPREASNPGMKAKYCRLSALAKGFLTRRLLQADKVQELIKTIHDTREFAFSVQAETPIKKGNFSLQDRDLLERIVAQLQAALLDIHEIFFLIPAPDRMALIASSREKERARHQRTSASTELRGSNPRLSSATLKALERKRKAQEAEVAVFGTTQTRPRTAPSTSSPRCHSHSTDLRSERERPKTAPEKNKVSQAGNRRKTSTSNTPTAATSSSTSNNAAASAASGKSTKNNTQVRNKTAGTKPKARPSSGKAWR